MARIKTRRARRSVESSGSVHNPVKRGLWPKPPNEPIKGEPFYDPEWCTKEVVLQDRDYQARDRESAWAWYNSLCYNGLLTVKLENTPFLGAETMTALGLYKPILKGLEELGLGYFALRSHLQYPELVRQLLASVEVFYEDEYEPTASTGVMMFYLEGKKYKISIKQLCRIYGMDESVENVLFPTEGKLRGLRKLWKAMASGAYLGDGGELALIRNPTVRIIAEVIGKTLLGKEDMELMTQEEVSILFWSIFDIQEEVFESKFPGIDRINLGAVFARNLVEKKWKGLGVPNRLRTECIGSILTPIFEYLKIDLQDTPSNYFIQYMDEEYLAKRDIVRDRIYHFKSDRGIDLYCQLPLNQWTSLECVRNLAFNPPAELQCTVNGIGFEPINYSDSDMDIEDNSESDQRTQRLCLGEPSST